MQHRRNQAFTSLNRPDGNVTGVVFTSGDLTAKRLGLLHELVPNTVVIAVLLDPNAATSEQVLIGVEGAHHAPKSAWD